MQQPASHQRGRRQPHYTQASAISDAQQRRIQAHSLTYINCFSLRPHKCIVLHKTPNIQNPKTLQYSNITVQWGTEVQWDPPESHITDRIWKPEEMQSGEQLQAVMWYKPWLWEQAYQNILYTTNTSSSESSPVKRQLFSWNLARTTGCQVIHWKLESATSENVRNS